MAANDVSGVAIVRQRLAQISGVTRTWIEWDTNGDGLTKTLVVEVDFDTDPNARGYRQSILDAIETTTQEVLRTETTMVFGHLRVIPRLDR